MNILEELQRYVADKLNADPQLSACPFLVENRKDIDYEIKNALGRQGIVGLVMTPKATYAGAYMDVGIAWQIDQLEIDVVENVTVNRGKKTGYITGQDAAMRLFDVLCPLNGEHEGQFSPVSYDEGEDNSLLVNKSVLKCLVHKLPSPEMRTKVTYADGSSLMVEVEGVLSSSSIPSINDVVEVEIGNAVTSIGEYAFDRCSYLETVVIPKSVETIGTQGFSRTARLTNVTIEGNGLKVIGDGAFVAATALTSISLPDSVISIGLAAFRNCSGLTSVAIPDSVTSIGKYAFTACSSLTNVVIPDSLSSISNYAFSHCSGLSSVTIPDSVTSIWYGAFYNCRGLESVTIPDGVKNIDDYAFHGCSGLSSVTIGNGVTRIGDWAFYNCRGLESVTIGDSLTSIGDLAFYSCIVLTSVEFEGNAPTVGEQAFIGVASGCKAVISSTATGFPAAGETWNGLVVEVKS